MEPGIVRTRPAPAVAIASLIQAPDRFSFPSGHAAVSMSAAPGVSVVVAPMVAGLLVAFAAIVGLSRCYLGAHYPGDVVAGWLLAIVAFIVLAA